MRTDSRTASWRRMRAACARRPTISRTRATEPMAPGSARAMRPVADAATTAPTIATASCASAASLAHHLDQRRRSQGPPGTLSTGTRGANAASTATATAAPAARATAVSSIEAVQQAVRVGDACELGAHPLGQCGQGADAVPAAVLAEGHQLLHGRAAVVDPRDGADRQQPACASGAARSREARVKDEVDGGHDLAEHGLAFR